MLEMAITMSQVVVVQPEGLPETIAQITEIEENLVFVVGLVYWKQYPPVDQSSSTKSHCNCTQALGSD